MNDDSREEYNGDPFDAVRCGLELHRLGYTPYMETMLFREEETFLGPEDVTTRYVSFEIIYLPCIASNEIRARIIVDYRKLRPYSEIVSLRFRSPLFLQPLVEVEAGSPGFLRAVADATRVVGARRRLRRRNDVEGNWEQQFESRES